MRWGLGWVIAALLLVACSNASEGDPCGDGCPMGLVCAFGRCRTGCSSELGCAGGDATRTCLWDPASETYACSLPREQCVGVGECPEPLVCHAGLCRNPCREDAECGPLGRCVEQPDGARVCEVGAADDGGVPLIDSGVSGRPIVPQRGWTLADECVPPMEGAGWASIGRGCATDGDCPPERPFCDPERTTEVSVAGADQPLLLRSSPGGTCVATAPGTCSTDGCDACSDCIGSDFDVAPPCSRVDDCPPLAGGAEPICDRGQCRPACSTDVPCPGGLFCDRGACVPPATCADACDPFGPDPERGGCRPGYACEAVYIGVFEPTVTYHCAPGCSSDLECQVLGRGVSELSWDPSLRGACDEGVCVNPGGPDGGGFLADCVVDEDCGAGLYCSADRLARFRQRPLAGPRYGVGGGSCTHLCADDADCEEGGRCDVYGVCGRACEVGAEPPEDRLGRSGHGAGCRPGFRCGPTPDPLDDPTAGICEAGNYNDQRDDNIGVDCQSGFEPVVCYSPGGFGWCSYDDGPFCTTVCGIPGLPESVCGELSACVEGQCRRRCADAEECNPVGGGGFSDTTFACAASAGERLCTTRCADASECPEGDRCLDGYCESDFRRCRTPGSRGSSPRVYDASLATPDADGWATVAFPPSFILIELDAGCGLSRIGAVEVVAEVDGVIEAEIADDPYRLRASRRSGCDEIGDLGCGADDGSLRVPVTAGQTVWIEVLFPYDIDTPTFPAPTTLRFRFSPTAGFGDGCEPGRTICDPGLECQSSAAGPLCLPPSCGDSAVLVLDLLAESTTASDGAHSVTLSDSGVDVFRPSCEGPPSADITGQDVFLRYQPSEPERILIEAPQVSVRTTCDVASSEIACRSDFGSRGTEGIRLDEDGTRPLFVLLEAPTMTWWARPRRAAGRSCDPRTDLCADGLGCIDGICQVGPSECGPGVGFVDLGRVGPGTHTFTDDLRFWDPLSCGGGLSGVRVVRFTPTVDVELTAESSTMESLTIAVRRDCDDPSTEADCGSRPSAGQIGTLLADEPVYVMLGPPSGVTPPTSSTVSLTLDPVARLGEACGAVPCEARNVCAGGVCVAGRCGDGAVSFPEVCDDGNRVAGDGCSATCDLEAVGPGGDTCAAAQRVTLVAAGAGLAARYRADPAGATDTVTPTCGGGGVERVFLTSVPPGTYDVDVRIVSGAGTLEARVALQCTSASPTMPYCAAVGGTAAPVTAVAVPGGLEYVLIADPSGAEPLVFDLVFRP